MPTFYTVFNEQLGDTPEAYDIEITYGTDLTSDGFDDIKVKITQTAGTNSGGEDTIGVAFDLSAFPTGLTITDINVLTGTTTYVATSGIAEDDVGSSHGTDPGFNTNGGGVDAPYDAFVKISDQGAGEGIASSFEFTLTADTHLDFGTMFSGTDWFLRTQTTEGGGSAKTGGWLGELCFAEGTMIATPEGERPVEELSRGDIILTADGRQVPVRWMGYQTIMSAFRPAARLGMVRITAGTLGPEQHSDLDLTAGHGVFIDGIVVNAGALVNGTTVYPVPKCELGPVYRVYHIETADHDIILANGAPSETFVENSDRATFDNYDEYLAIFGEPPAKVEMPYPRVLSPRQLPAAIRARIGGALAA